MIEKNNWAAQAIEKLKAGKVSGRKAQVMEGPVREALKDFCEQDEEFAQAVVQGGTFPECMAAVAKSTGSAISDIEAYTKAVQFYFPGAEIRVQMTIDMVGAAAGDADARQDQHEEKPKILELGDFFKSF